MYKVPCNNPFILFSPDSWSKPAQLFKSQLLAIAYTSPWGYASVILLWSCMSNGINSHKKCVRRQPKVSNPAAVLNFWNSELSSFSIALLKFSLMLQSIQSWSLGTFAFLYIFSFMLSLGLFTCSLCSRRVSFFLQIPRLFYTQWNFNGRWIHFFFFLSVYTGWNTDNSSMWRFTSQMQRDIGKRAVCMCVSEYRVRERREKIMISLLLLYLNHST